MMGKALAFFTGVPSIVWIVAGAIAVFSTYTIGVYQAGRNYQESIDGAAALRLENARQAAVIQEKDRQLTEVNAIQGRDTVRALTLEADLAQLRKQLSEIPENTNPGISAPSVSRLRRIR